MDHAVMKVNDSTPGPPRIDQLEVEASIPGEGVFAATQNDGPEEEVALIHQACLKRLGREISSAYREIVCCVSLHPQNRFDVELPLKGGFVA
jgi:hypothetical protein